MRTWTEFAIWATTLLILGAITATLFYLFLPNGQSETAQIVDGLIGIGSGALCIVGAFVIVWLYISHSDKED